MLRNTPRRLLRLLPLLTALGAADAVASAVVYHSPGDDGVDPAAPVVLSQPSDSLYLYVDGGSTPSSSGACESGSGDEVCAWQAEIEASGELAITGFLPDPAMDVTWTESGVLLRANGLHAVNGRLGPARIGELQLSVGASGSVELTGGSAVGADLGLTSLPPRVLAVPEPHQLWLLGTGIATLAGLARVRRRP